MGFLDFIPSIGEIWTFVACRLVDHDWIELEDGKVVCSDCRKPAGK